MDGRKRWTQVLKGAYLLAPIEVHVIQLDRKQVVVVELAVGGALLTEVVGTAHLHTRPVASDRRASICT